jgi:DNA-binding MarR family transcriptional regulator
VVDASPDRRLPIGQLLVNHMRLFRQQLYGRTVELGFSDLRPAHLHVFGSIKAEGTRLTDLAEWTNMGRSSMAELIDDLQAKGYVERRPDPRDGRAKLVCLTERGWAAMRTGRNAIQTIEADYARRIGHDRFDEMCATLEDLLRELDPGVVAAYREPPPGPEDGSAARRRVFKPSARRAPRYDQRNLG